MALGDVGRGGLRRTGRGGNARPHFRHHRVLAWTGDLRTRSANLPSIASCLMRRKAARLTFCFGPPGERISTVTNESVSGSGEPRYLPDL